ncbi:MAG: ferredoxin [Pseudomonadota bacterium]
MFDHVQRSATAVGLTVVGGFHPQSADDAAEGVQTVVLLGPGGSETWDHFCQSTEYSDGLAHGMDRWSRRVITALGEDLDAEPAFPFGGPPWLPFQKWATWGEHAVPSPVGMQASPSRGLWASYRGALMFRMKLDLPEWPDASPCSPCAQPCRTACPIGAFQDGSYDAARCADYVRSEAGHACRDGCLVRKSCPAGQQIALPTAQREFHMQAFLSAN